MKILTVDDNEQMRNLLRITFLSHSEYELLQAKNGIEALELVQKFNPDIVFLDVMMPGDMDGFEICQRIKSSDNENCFVILLTAKSEKSDIEKGMVVGADMYLTKPFSPFNLIEIVENFKKSKGISIKIPHFPQSEEMSDSYKQLKGFDSKRLQILEMMLGSEEAVFGAIKKFADDFSDIQEKIAQLLNENSAKEMLHTLKGTASNVGANRIAELAADIEMQLKDSQDVQDKLSELFVEWRTIITTASNLTIETQFNRDLAEITKELIDNKLIPKSLLESLRNQAKIEQYEVVESFIKHIRSYDYDTALKLAKKLRTIC